VEENYENLVKHVEETFFRQKRYRKLDEEMIRMLASLGGGLG
jgi:hypothetical protein